MKISAISVSNRKGIRKKNIDTAQLITNYGIKDDAHAGDWHRQVSLLAQESIDTMRQKGLDVVAGNFAENITTSGINLTQLTVGTHLQVGTSELIISQLGKICHNRCAIYHQAGDCVMPREGIFAVVHRGGIIHTGDVISILPEKTATAAVIAPISIQTNYLDSVVSAITKKYNPSFLRLDKVEEDPSKVDQIIDDLTVHQKIDSIALIDPAGIYKLAFLDCKKIDDFPTYHKGDSLIQYFQASTLHGK